MKSRWFIYKEQVLLLRSQGVSMTTIEREFGIARSTLSGWFKEVNLTEEQRTQLMANKLDGWKIARAKAVITKNVQKAKRLADAQADALLTLNQIQLDDAVLDLALAMLYLGEGAKEGKTSIASSDPKILRFVLYVLKRNYDIKSENIRCELHLRMDQVDAQLREYWSNELNLPLSCFKYTAFDKRSSGKATYDHYKGVCVIDAGSIAIQRKIINLYTLFCEKVSNLEDVGA